MNWLSQEVDLTYQIRTAYTACIMLDGVKTGRDGCLCCCTTNCAKDDSDARGITPLDEFSGCAITLKASTENSEIDADDIGGDGERVVVRAPPLSQQRSPPACVRSRSASPLFNLTVGGSHCGSASLNALTITDSV